jgi:hypothetical protein
MITANTEQELTIFHHHQILVDGLRLQSISHIKQKQKKNFLCACVTYFAIILEFGGCRREFWLCLFAVTAPCTERDTKSAVDSIIN